LPQSFTKKLALNVEEGRLLLGGLDPLRSQMDAIPNMRDRLENENLKKLRAEVSYLQLRLRSYELQEKLKSKSTEDEAKQSWKKRIVKILPYLVAGIGFSIFTLIVARAYYKDQVKISINYDVGVITGGILVGSAALITAAAYARKSQVELNSGSVIISDRSER